MQNRKDFPIKVSLAVQAEYAQIEQKRVNWISKCEESENLTASIQSMELQDFNSKLLFLED